MERQIDIPVSSDCVAGHFPHRPLVPGALLCGAVAMTMEAQLGAAVLEVAKLRFSAPVPPGTRLSLYGELRSESCWRMRLAADGREVLRGLFSVAAAAEPALCDALADPDSGDFSVEDLGTDVSELYAALPHAGAMRLLETVRGWNASSLVATSRSHGHPDHPLRLSGRLHGLAALEYAAQCCALHGVLAGRLGGNAGGTGTTVVATVQQLRLRGGDLDRSGPELRAAVHCVLRQNQSAAYQCSVTDGAGWQLEATLGLMLAAD